MAHFFFDLHNGSVLERDEIGIDLPDFESAYLEAHRAAIDMWIEARREGRKPAYRCFEIRDAQDRMVTEIPFSEVLDIRVEKPSGEWRPGWLTDEVIKIELRQADAGIASGERHIANQRARITRMEQKGYSAALARDLLKTLLQTRALQEQHRDLLRRELAE